MNVQERIDECLRAAPKPAAPEGLLSKLHKDVAVPAAKKRRALVRRWFAPTAGAISPWRVAAAAVIAVMVLLSLSYGAGKVIKKIFPVLTDKVTFDYPQDNAVYTVSRGIFVDGTNEEEAKRNLEEFKQLYQEGKAEQVKPGVWVVTLSDGEKFAYGGDPERIGVEFTEEEKEQLKKQFDEINELRKAGQFEKTYKPENDFVVDGVKYRYFEARYTLSDGRVVTLGESEPANDDDDQ